MLQRGDTFKYLQTKNLIKEQMKKHNLDQSFWNVV